MATTEGTLKVKIVLPRWRMWSCIAAAWVMSPFVRKTEVGERIGAAMFEWVKRGVRIYGSKGKRIG